jgi:O-methyltransferase involved in polyketide biosynthesis
MSPDEAAGSYGTLQKVEGIHKVKMRFDRYGDAYAARDRNVEDTLYTVTNASGDLCMVSEGCGLDTVSRRVGGKLDPAGLQALVEELRVF